MKNCEPIACPAVEELPPAPSGVTGWPWTEGSPLLHERMVDGREWPVLSILMCSFRQGKYIEETIRSILLQGYPRLQFVIMDGQSDDETTEILEKYDRWISYWISEPDRGQGDAVNKAFRISTGQIVGWQNSDDIYFPGAFRRAAEVLWPSSDIDCVYGRTATINPESKIISRPEECDESPFRLQDMIPWPNLHNEALFIRRALISGEDLLDTQWRRCMDIDLFYRLAKQPAKFLYLPELFAGRRIHPDAKGSVDVVVVTEEYRRIYMDMAQNPDLDPAVHRKAVECIQMFAHRDWKARHFQMMRDSLNALRSLPYANTIPVSLRLKSWTTPFLREKEPRTGSVK